MQQDEAETVALRALGWLAANDELLPVFMGATGASVDDLHSRAGAPDFLAAVLEFLTMDDAWITTFAAEAGLPNTAPFEALQRLAGRDRMHWT